MEVERKKQLTIFLDNYKIKYKDLSLINQAFFHSSFSNKCDEVQNSNERLEFLGDSVLSLCISNYLYNKFKDADEGKLTRIRGYVVSEKILSKLSTEIGLGDLLLLSWGEENSGGRIRSANLANLFEAFLGAIYIDSG